MSYWSFAALREFGIDVAFTWAGVMAGWGFYTLRPTHLMGDKSNVLFPLVVGSIAGSVAGLVLIDRLLRSSSTRTAIAVVVAVLGSMAGVTLGVLLMDKVKPLAAAIALPFIVSVCSYVAYALAVRLVTVRRMAVG